MGFLAYPQPRDLDPLDGLHISRFFSETAQDFKSNNYIKEDNG